MQHIGLEEDDNRNLTQRMLLMLESVAVVGEDVHRRCWEQVLDRYLAEGRSDHRPPRFFLNDVMRYWRTIAVDFAGKHKDDERKWGLRNAKLRTSRKMLFAGGLVPILRCHALRGADVQPFLAQQLALPASDRVADAFLSADQVDAGVRCLGAYDRWIGMVGDTATREELAGLDRASARDSATFIEVRRLAAEFQNGLLALLFETFAGPGGAGVRDLLDRAPATIETVPDRLHFTESDEANALIAGDPFALLVGFVLDQQVTVQKAFSGPLAIKERLGAFDAATLADADLDTVFREKPAVHRYPGAMAQRVHDLAVYIRDTYDGDAARVWTDANNAAELRANLQALPGFGEMKVKSMSAVLAKRYNIAIAQELVPWHPTLGDVDSAQALTDYQAAKRIHKAEWTKAKAPA